MWRPGNSRLPDAPFVNETDVRQMQEQNDEYTKSIPGYAKMHVRCQPASTIRFHIPVRERIPADAAHVQPDYIYFL